VIAVHTTLFRLAAASGCMLALTACGGPRSEGAGQSAINLVMFQSTRPPEVTNPLPRDEPSDFECPSVAIRDGGAALRVGGATADSLRSQISINNVARECILTGGNGFTLKVGVDGRVLAGPAGGSGGMQATLRTIVRRGTTVVAQRVSRVGASIPSGEGGANFTHVEDGIVVPAGSGDVDIEIGLDGAGAASGARRRRR
jgi:hypothetical protein